MNPRRVIAVLSGGGAKAAAHVGAFRALDAAGLTPTHYVATSMGAVIAAGLAAGLAPAELLQRIARAGNRGAVRERFVPVAGLYLRSLLRPEPLRRVIAEFVAVQSFAELAVPLTVTVTDLDCGALIRLGAGAEDAPLVDALYASCALPVFYPPAMIAGRRCADGGLRGAIPLGAAAELPADLVVAVDVGPGFDEAPAAAPPMPALLRAHHEATGILMAANSAAHVALWRAEPGRAPLLYVRPRAERHATFRVERAGVYAEEGYRATMETLKIWERRGS